VVVHPKGNGWTFTAVRTADEAQYRHAATLPTPAEAKLAAFDFLWPALARVA
jgi:hypothetical protein